MTSERTAGTPPPVDDLSYEEARDELVAIVARIEGGGASLEESMTLWERGEALAAHCQAKLNQAQEQLDRGAAPTGAVGAATGKATGDATGSAAGASQAADSGPGDGEDDSDDA